MTTTDPRLAALASMPEAEALRLVARFRRRIEIAMRPVERLLGTMRNDEGAAWARSYARARPWVTL